MNADGADGADYDADDTFIAFLIACGIYWLNATDNK